MGLWRTSKIQTIALVSNASRKVPTKFGDMEPMGKLTLRHGAMRTKSDYGKIGYKREARSSSLVRGGPKPSSVFESFKRFKKPLKKKKLKL